MQRGVITLNALELAALVPLVQSMPQLVPLAHKLETEATHEKNELDRSAIKLEISREDAESILDALPPPSQIENKQLTNIQTKLRTFLGVHMSWAKTSTSGS